MIVFERGFHGRTLLTLTMTEKVDLQGRLRAVRARGLPRPGARTRTAGSRATTRSRRSSGCCKAEVDPASVACAVLEPVQGEGGFIPMPPDFLARLRELLDRHGILYVDDEVQSGVGRTGEVWAIEHYAASSRTCSSPASRSAAGCRSRRSRAAPS